MVEMLKGDGKAIFTVFVGAIIAIVFLASIGDAVFDQSNTFTLANATVTAPATNASVAIEGRELIGTPTVVNDTNSSQQDLQDVGVFIDERVINGVKTVALTVNQTGDAFGNVTISDLEFVSESNLNGTENLVEELDSGLVLNVNGTLIDVGKSGLVIYLNTNGIISEFLVNGTEITKVTNSSQNE
ncbi:hypothetical protein LCGC14_1922520 [marine sediment metagenome]|uniref:Uncharacterized protein n=1 Tax=marine sediment metagenome TaxID=412755 RepID=A0A0F9FQ49_9ZZZZ